MNEENNWKEFSDDISNISKKIKSSITDEENIEDLKNSLKATRESISNNFNDLVRIVENTVKDEERCNSGRNGRAGTKFFAGQRI